ncbi:MAG: CPBP family intramembrane metalloprotease, partial [Akkermansiaceae bacterium]|nr:CPBP family intramembrane metalloprotease [Akkermansiaceae bacterium]
GPRRGERPQPWSVRLPDGGRRCGGQPLARGWSGWREGMKGGVLALALVLVVGWALVRAGAFGWRGMGPGVAAGALAVVPVALLGAVAHEVLFRGVVLGVFLRALRAPAAIGLAGLLYALVVFMVPPDNVAVADPEGRLAGFVVLVGRWRELADPWLMAGGLLPWLAFGCVLGFARWRTRSLWLPLGVHAGWALGNGLFLLLVVPLNQPDPIARVLVGASLSHGLIPVAVVALAGMVIHFLTPVPDAGYEPY